MDTSLLGAGLGWVKTFPMLQLVEWGRLCMERQAPSQMPPEPRGFAGAHPSLVLRSWALQVEERQLWPLLSTSLCQTEAFHSITLI